VPEPSEINALASTQSPDKPLALLETTGRSVRHLKPSEVQNLILQRGVTGFKKNGAFQWVCKRSKGKRDHLLLGWHDLTRSVSICLVLTVAFFTDDGRCGLEEDADRF